MLEFMRAKPCMLWWSDGSKKAAVTFQSDRFTFRIFKIRIFVRGSRKFVGELEGTELEFSQKERPKNANPRLR